jgi:hypothetical protein
MLCFVGILKGSVCSSAEQESGKCIALLRGSGIKSAVDINEN